MLKISIKFQVQRIQNPLPQSNSFEDHSHTLWSQFNVAAANERRGIKLLAVDIKAFREAYITWMA